MKEPLQKKTIARTQPQNPTAYYHITSLRVPLFEVDTAQAVYHGNYYHLFELAREDLLRAIGFPYREFMNRQLHLSIVETHCKYRKALKYDDEIEIRTGISAMGSRSLAFSQLIFRRADASPAIHAGSEPELCTEARLDMVCVSFAGRAKLLPKDFRLAAEALVDRVKQG
jgi:acyl-CoA thioester hydrolase